MLNAKFPVGDRRLPHPHAGGPAHSEGSRGWNSGDEVRDKPLVLPLAQPKLAFLWPVKTGCMFVWGLQGA